MTTQLTLTVAQHAILQHIQRNGYITSTQAGIILHGRRRMPSYLQRDAQPDECPRHAAKRLKNIVPAAAASNHWPSDRATACCPWAATDGSAAMHRLHNQGAVTQHPERRGHWTEGTLKP